MNALNLTFKIRASAASKIAAGVIGLTDVQKSRLKELLDRKKLYIESENLSGHEDEEIAKEAIKSAKKAKLTPKMESELEELIGKEKSKELPAGLKTYCKEWLKEKLYGRRKEFTSKYTDKGNMSEGVSIKYIAKQLNYGFLVKNSKREENEWFTGECDVKTKDEILDAKNSWDFSTFPLFAEEVPNQDYYWQGIVYMDLYKRFKYRLCYVLSNTPESLIVREAKGHAYKNGIEYTEELLEEFRSRMTYDDIPDGLKIRDFRFEYSNSDAQHLKDRVGLCQEFIDQEIEKLINQNRISI